MANYVVYLDQGHADIFELHASQVDEHSLKRREIKTHSGNEKTQGDDKKFFDEVAGALSGAREILLLGHGMAKTHFKHHLDTHHKDSLSKKIVGIETVDHPTGGQIVALAKKFFRAHLQFE